MTIEEVYKYINTNFGLNGPWPGTWEVDAETYGNICHFLFGVLHEGAQVTLHLGPNGGPIFKGMELILKGKS